MANDANPIRSMIRRPMIAVVDLPPTGGFACLTNSGPIFIADGYSSSRDRDFGDWSLMSRIENDSS